MRTELDWTNKLLYGYAQSESRRAPYGYAQFTLPARHDKTVRSVSCQAV